MLGFGGFDFVPLLRGDDTLNTVSWHISDHYPLFGEFALPIPVRNGTASHIREDRR